MSWPMIALLAVAAIAIGAIGGFLGARRAPKMSERFSIALLVLALYGGASIVMTFVEIPEANRDAVLQLTGGVITLAGLVVGFYFGKSTAAARRSIEEEE